MCEPNTFTPSNGQQTKTLWTSLRDCCFWWRDNTWGEIERSIVAGSTRKRLQTQKVPLQLQQPPSKHVTGSLIDRSLSYLVIGARLGIPQFAYLRAQFSNLPMSHSPLWIKSWIVNVLLLLFFSQWPLQFCVNGQLSGREARKKPCSRQTGKTVQKSSLVFVPFGWCAEWLGSGLVIKDSSRLYHWQDLHKLQKANGHTNAQIVLEKKASSPKMPKFPGFPENRKMLRNKPVQIAWVQQSCSLSTYSSKMFFFWQFAIKYNKAWLQVKMTELTEIHQRTYVLSTLKCLTLQGSGATTFCRQGYQALEQSERTLLNCSSFSFAHTRAIDCANGSLARIVTDIFNLSVAISGSRMLKLDRLRTSGKRTKKFGRHKFTDKVRGKNICELPKKIFAKEQRSAKTQKRSSDEFQKTSNSLTTQSRGMKWHQWR